ncbi:MAG: bi-domain-containing oxidoreductase [Anaerolineales bacterium]|nr:bi-domain-containing oxidoreductase [Anaerolineales bacterium]
MKQLLQSMRDGESRVVDVPVPTPQPGMILIKTAASLVSAGTERMVVEFAEKSLLGKVRSRPDLAKQVLDKARREGVLSTIEAAFNRLDQPMALGYSSAGTIVEIGEGVEGFQIGQRVACAGGGYAVHAEYAVVPANLAASLPDNVDFESGAFGTLGAIALHGFRLGQPQVGETVAVIGLGLLGLISVGLARAAGCRVFGIDLDANRVELARQMGAEAVVRPEAEGAAIAFTESFGADVVLICADSTSNDPVELAGAIARDKGKVIAVGAVGMELPRRVYFYKELDFIVSRSYGPGRYDPSYEEGGHDYPIGFIRWTAGRNLGAFVNLIGDGLLDISPLISHRFPIEQGAQAYEMITGKLDEPFLGVLLTYPDGALALAPEQKTVRFSDAPRTKLDVVQLGAIGAGNFAGAVIFPVAAKHKNIELVGVASGSGRSAQHAASKHGFSYATSDVEQLIHDPAVNTLAVLTRHHLHAGQTLAGLRAGKHVFCEKPLALNRAELSAIEAELALPDTPLLMAGYNRRFAPLAAKMHAFLKSSPEPMSIHYRVNAGYIPPEHWVHDPEQGGGRILGEGCHFIDFVTWLVGSLPSEVGAKALPDIGRYRGDNVLIQLTYPGGSIATVSYMANGDRSFSKERVEVTTGGRAAVLDDFRVLETYANGIRKVEKSRLRLDKGHAGEWDAFTDAILAGGPPPIPYEQLVGVMAATFDAVEALR